MKNENPLAGLTLLFVMLVTLGETQAQVPRKFGRIDSLGHDSILTRTDGAFQQKQPPAASTSKAPPQVQYMVIELGGRRANDITGSGEIVGSMVSTPEPIH